MRIECDTSQSLKGVLDRFFDYPIHSEASVQSSLHDVLNQNSLSKSVAQAILDYNQSIHNDQKALDNTEQLFEPNALTVVTGQQLGLMGGPLLTILKAVTAIQVARQFDAVPIFWLATEDHDVDEIRQVITLNDDGNLDRYSLDFPKRHFVEDLILNESHLSVIEKFCHKMGVSLDCKAGELYAKVMARLLTKVFEGKGLVLVEPHIFRPFSQNIYAKEIQDSKNIQATLEASSKRLVESGIQPPLSLDHSTNLFYKNEDGERVKVDFGHHSKSAWLDLLKKHPERFSSNAALRPVVQNAFLNPIAYVAGPTELAYHQQLQDYHRYHQVKMPAMVSRLSATMINEKGAKILKEQNTLPWTPLKVTGKDGHYLRNLIHPKEKMQERVLSWWNFHREGLITDMLERIDWKTKGHYYIWTSSASH